MFCWDMWIFIFEFQVMVFPKLHNALMGCRKQAFLGDVSEI